MRRLALIPGLACAVVCGCAGPRATEAPEQPSVVGDIALAAGDLHLEAAGDETRYDAAWASLEAGLRPWAPDAPGHGLQAGIYAGVDVVRFSSPSYSGIRVAPAIGLDLLWSDVVLEDRLLCSVTLRPHLAAVFERSEVSAEVGDEDRNTALLSVDLLASFYRLPPVEGSSSTALWPELHLRAVLEHDLDADSFASDQPAVRGRGAQAIAPGSPVLEGDERDLGRLLLEVTLYAVRFEVASLELALGATGGLTRTHAFYYLGVDDGDPVHAFYGGPVLRLGAPPNAWLIAACPILFEHETGRWGPTASLSLLYAF